MREIGYIMTDIIFWAVMIFVGILIVSIFVDGTGSSLPEFSNKAYDEQFDYLDNKEQQT